MSNRASRSPRCAAGFRYHAADRTRGLAGHFRRSGKAGAGGFAAVGARALAESNWRNSMAALYERRTGPRKVALESALAPWSHGNAVLPGRTAGPVRDRFLPSRSVPDPLPEDDRDIAYAPVTRLSRWIEQRKLTSQRLTQIYLTRLERFDPKLRCVITLTPELALEQARQADAGDRIDGKYRGPLHGIPWGVKDLLDTAGIPTTGSRTLSGSWCPAGMRRW